MERVFILDRSGSMQTCRDDTIGGYNAFIQAQKDLGGTMTLYLFDHEIQTVYEKKDIVTVEPLTSNTFVPRGSTALYDAIGYAITRVPGKVTFVIFTDGQENASRKYGRDAIRDLIEMRRRDGSEFLYLGADESTFDEATSIGISQNDVTRFDVHDSPATFDAIDRCIRARSSGVNTPLGDKNTAEV
jgi:hypothetical protein